MKIKRLWKVFLAVVLFVMSFCFVVIPTTFEAQAATEEVWQEDTVETVVPLATSDSISPPSFTYDRNTYLFAVKYDWQAGAGGNRVALARSTAGSYEVYGNSSHYTEIAFPDYPAVSSRTMCNPNGYYFKTYNTTTNLYSSEYTTSQHSVYNGTYYSVEYGWDCQRTPSGSFTARASTTVVPTKFDQVNFIWEHGGNNKKVIIATIGYENTAYNIQLDIPWIGLKKKSVNINGIEFTLRTGPNKCSVCCNRDNVSSGSFNFAFAVVDEGAVPNVVYA